jgi:hypothetical protein
MRTQEDLKRALEIMHRHPALWGIVDPGIDTSTVLTRRGLKSLDRDSFRALCTLPLDFVVPDSVRDLFLGKAGEHGVKIYIDKNTKGIRVKKFE